MVYCISLTAKLSRYNFCLSLVRCSVLSRVGLLAKNCSPLNCGFSSKTYVLAFVLFLFWHPPIQALPSAEVHQCQTRASSDYEKIYCQILAQGEGSSLPAWDDFVRNNRQVQRLLLKHPASRLNISLPAVSATSSPGVAADFGSARSTGSRAGAGATISTATGMKDNSTISVVKSGAPRPLSVSTSVATPPVPPSASLPQRQFSPCQLQQTHIICANVFYHLQENVGNNRLNPEVFLSAYTLDLPEFVSAADDPVAIDRYLTDAYERYLQKMIAIGLGGSTMSYTRFYHTFMDLRARQVSFSQRFETMYTYLKKDKQQMQVKKRLSDRLPDSLSQCDRVGGEYFVCDLDEVNWVYRLQ